jgi:hypothetical protein
MRGVPPAVVPTPEVDGAPDAEDELQPGRCADPVVPPDPLGAEVDWPGVGAGVGPVPLGMRVSLEPVPGVPAFDGKVND